MDIVVVGAGVIGLSSAFKLNEHYNGSRNITIISDKYPDANEFNPFYTSSKSGAHFRPFPSKNDNEFRDSKLTHHSYSYFRKLSVEYPESSVRFVDGIDYLEYENDLYENLSRGYTDVVEDFKLLDKDELPANVKFGAMYKTYVMNPHKYLKFLLDELRKKKNIKIITNYVPSLEYVAKKFPNSIIINCTGNGLLFDGNFDSECFPIRGQTLLVRPPNKAAKYKTSTVTFQLANGEWCFVIPRPLDGGLILGGTKQLDSSSFAPCTRDTNSLVKNAKSRFPELFEDDGTLNIVHVNVGFRPGRHSGVRIEQEIVDGNIKIIHCYGFGGSGMEMSWGAANEVCNLVDESVPKL